MRVSERSTFLRKEEGKQLEVYKKCERERESVPEEEKERGRESERDIALQIFGGPTSVARKEQ